jgi:Transposase DDE domain
MSAIGTEAALAAMYAGFLLGASVLLDMLARHTHHRSLRFRVVGFLYHEHLDAWECPEGQHLWPVEHDHERRLVRYRGKPHICNACPVKADCTDSDEGREVVRFLDPWFRTEAGRFHRAFALMLVVLSLVVAAVGLARNHEPGEAVLLVAILAIGALVALRLALPLGLAISAAATSSGEAPPPLPAPPPR